LQPLAAVQQHLMVVDGIDMTCAVGEQNQAGLIGLLTGTSQTGSPVDFANGPSLDQVLATRLSVELLVALAKTDNFRFRLKSELVP